MLKQLKKIISYLTALAIIIGGVNSSNVKIMYAKDDKNISEKSFAKKENYIIKYNKRNDFLLGKKKYAKKRNINHKKKDEKYLEEENILSLNLSTDEVNKLKKESDCSVEKNYSVSGLGLINSCLPEVPISYEEYCNSNLEEYSDDPTEFVPCSNVNGKESDEILPWNIECVAGDPRNNKYTGKGVKVAVIDSGIDVHNDLATKQWIDFSDKVNGYKPIDNNGHGTEIAGIIAAQKNNYGMIGISYDSDIYSVKILDKNNEGYISSVIKAIEWCIDNNIDVINMSFGLDENSSLLYSAIKKAYDKGILLIAASGNNNTIQYPARYNEVLSVGGIDKELKRTSYSNNTNSDIYAPAEECQTTGFVGSFVKTSGTSIAAAHVTGVASALKSFDLKLSNKKMMKLLKNAAIKCDDINGQYGIVNYNNTINMCLSDSGYDEEVMEVEAINEVIDNNSYVYGSWSKDIWNDKNSSIGTGHYSMINCLDTEYFAVGAGNYTEKTYNRWIVADAAYRTDSLAVYKDKSWKSDAELQGSGYQYPPYHANTHYSTTTLRYVIEFLYELSRQRLVNGLWFSFDPNSYNNKDEYKGVYIPVKLKKRIVKDMNSMNQSLKAQYAGTTISMDKISSQGYMIMGVLLHMIGDFYCHRAMVTKDMFFTTDSNGNFEYAYAYNKFGTNCYDSRISEEYFDGVDDNRGWYDYIRVYEYITEYGGLPINRLKGKMRKYVDFEVNGTLYENKSAANAFEDNPYFYSNRYSASCYVVNETLNDMKNRNATTNLYGFLSWGVPIYEDVFNYNFKNEKWGYNDNDDE